MQDIAKGYIFTLYPEHDAAIQEYAEVACRGNRSEALRRIIEAFGRGRGPSADNGHNPTPEITASDTTLSPAASA